MTTKQHIFTDLGIAPYRLIANIEASEPTDRNPKPGLSCDHCGTYITNIFICESSDKKQFVVGSRCVEKLGDKGLTDIVKTKLAERRREKLAIKRLNAWEKSKAEFEQVKHLLAEQPHPNEYFASRGKTMLDYVNYCGFTSTAGQQAIKRVSQ